MDFLHIIFLEDWMHVRKFLQMEPVDTKIGGFFLFLLLFSDIKKMYLNLEICWNVRCDVF